MEIRDFIGIAISGILGLLWFDIRSIRQNKAGYLKEEKHELLCENAALRFEKMLTKAKNEIIREIKDNNKK